MSFRVEGSPPVVADEAKDAFRERILSLKIELNLLQIEGEHGQGQVIHVEASKVPMIRIVDGIQLGTSVALENLCGCKQSTFSSSNRGVLQLLQQSEPESQRD